MKSSYIASIIALGFAFFIIDPFGIWRAVDHDKLELKNGLYYFQNSEDPFTGNAVATNMFGQKIFQGKYRKGETIHTILWHENGQKHREYLFKFGTGGMGSFNSWDDQGHKLEEAKLKRGEFDGKMTTYYSNGQKKSEGNYLNGKEKGLWTVWEEDGEIYSKRYFKLGSLVSAIGYEGGEISSKSYFKSDSLITLIRYHNGDSLVSNY